MPLYITGFHIDKDTLNRYVEEHSVEVHAAYEHYIRSSEGYTEYRPDLHRCAVETLIGINNALNMIYTSPDYTLDQLISLFTQMYRIPYKYRYTINGTDVENIKRGLHIVLNLLKNISINGFKGYANYIGIRMYVEFSYVPSHNIPDDWIDFC